MNETTPEPKNLKRYWPLFVLILIALLASLAVARGTQQGFMAWMHFFMGFFLCQFAMLKLFHPSGFADGFQMYDLVAKKFRPYAYVYPYIELALRACLSFLYRAHPDLLRHDPCDGSRGRRGAPLIEGGVGFALRLHGDHSRRAAFYSDLD